MLILGIHPGYHDAIAVLHDDYRLVAAVQLERLTRRKIDGGRGPGASVARSLPIARGAPRGGDAGGVGRGPYPWRFFSPLSRGGPG